MKIPSKLKIGGFTYKVIKNYKFKEISDSIGQTDHDVLEIRISYFDTGGIRRNQERIEEIFLHEVLHCIDRVYNSNKLDEETATRLSNGLYQVLKDNEGVFK